jgi:hypothetical protein
MFASKRSFSSSVLVVCGAIWVGCSSSPSGPAQPDATADGQSQNGDSATPEGGTGSPIDATMPVVSDDGSAVEASGDGGAQANQSDGGASDDGSQGSEAGPADSGGDGSPNGDASDSGISVDGASDAGDGSAALATHLLVPGTSLSITGITGDNYLVYYDGSTQTYYARPLSGGAPTAIYTAPMSTYAGYATIINNVVFCWSWNSNYIGTLVTWSSGMAQGVPLTTTGLAYLYQTMWASDDSKHVAYVQSTSSDATVSSLYGANADGSGVTLLLPNIDSNSYFTGQSPACFPRVVFRGDYAIVSSCTVADSGALTPTIQSFSISNAWAPAIVVPNAVASLQYNSLDRLPFTFSFAVDPDAGRVAAASASSGNGALQIFPIEGGTGTVVDPNVQISSSLSFAGSVNNPWAIFYNNGGGALMRAYAASPSPAVLVDGGVNFLNAYSNDGQWLLTTDNLNNGGWFADLSLVSTQNPGTPVLVASSSQYGGLPLSPRPISAGGNRGFTTDSNYVLVMTNLTESITNRWYGSLRSMAVAPPNTMKLLSNGPTADYALVRGSKVLMDDNYIVGDGGSSPTYDIDEADPSSTGPAVNIATGVPGDYGLSADLTQIAYTVATGATPGIYVAPVP